MGGGLYSFPLLTDRDQIVTKIFPPDIARAWWTNYTT